MQIIMWCVVASHVAQEYMRELMSWQKDISTKDQQLKQTKEVVKASQSCAHDRQ